MSELRSFERSLPMALMRAREAVMQQFRPALAAHDLTEQQWRVLRALTANASPMSVGRLADETYLLGPSLSRMLANLDQRGLIARSPDESDARRSEISVTPQGSRLVDAIAPLSEARYRWIEAQLGRDELERLYRLLDRVAVLTEC
jgi:homoprotocatechuate degradation regulator HpaR